ncbi:MAG: flagellin [Planctomycetota bacterium]|nr:MAG: flagellin [Planctomycetota bacterium]RLS94143.1 MAG: flagellin [Planctomycetota bacterium]
MARINTNVPSLIARSNLNKSAGDLGLRLQRLSTGLRINRGADDPAGLIVSERLRSEMKGIQQAINNSERASSVIATTEGYLAEVADLLNSIKSLVVATANTGGISQEEIDANQLQVDSAIESITRISNTASFAGLQLLNGSLEYLTSGVAPSAIAGANIHGVQFGGNSSIGVAVEVTQSAQTGALFFSGGVGTLASSITLEIAGSLGVQTLSFVSGTALSAVVAAVNTVKDTTGVSAELANGANQASGFFFNSTSFGSDEFVSVRRIGQGGAFWQTYATPGGNATQRDAGRDVTAIINGALATGNGTSISLNTPALSLDLDLTQAFATTVSGNPSTFDLVGGGATFQLGPSITTTQQVGVGITSVAASRIGGTTISNARYFLDSLKSGQTNALTKGRAAESNSILDAAVTEISVMRGRLGAFERNTLQTNSRSLQIGFENITASESKIRDTDFAEESAMLSRAQILQQAGTSVLATANSTAQNVLALLR